MLDGACSHVASLVLHPVQDAGTIPVLLPWLGARNPPGVQAEALHALYNLCKISRTRQEAAAVAGALPYLAHLAQPPPPAQVSGQPMSFFAFLPINQCSSCTVPRQAAVHGVVLPELVASVTSTASGKKTQQAPRLRGKQAPKMQEASAPSIDAEMEIAIM